MPRHRRPALALLLCCALAAAGRAQGDAVADPLPGPLSGPDEHTVALGLFNDSIALKGSGGGSKLVKSTATLHEGGLWGTSALNIPAGPAKGTVAIHRADGFSPALGTIEMWVRLPDDNPIRRSLFSLAGRGSLDGDGYNDLVVGEASPTGGTWSRILFGGPEGVDPAQEALFWSDMPRGLSVGDVDGDGVRDLVVSMNGLDQVHVFKGPFAAGQQRATPDVVLPVRAPQGHALADLEGDGDLDLLVASFDDNTKPVFGFENRGDGTFQSLPMPFYGVVGFAEALAVADVDKDGVLDVLVANFDTGLPSAVIRGVITPWGKWTIDLTEDELTSSLLPLALGADLADLDRDGWLDAVLALPFANAVTVHLNRKDGSFSAAPSIVVPTPGPFTVRARRDVDNDGFLDLVVANWQEPGGPSMVSRVYRGPSFKEALAFPVEGAVSFTHGDADGDGHADLFWRSSGESASRLYKLDVHGEIIGTQALPTTPTALNPNGPGIGVFSAWSGGTSPYSSDGPPTSSFELYVEDGVVHFVVTDRLGRPHTVALPFTTETSGVAEGYRHVQAEWDLEAGWLQLEVLPPVDDIPLVVLDVGAPIEVEGVVPVLRLGTDMDNQRPCRNCRLEDVRISDIRRSLGPTPEAQGGRAP